MNRFNWSNALLAVGDEAGHAADLHQQKDVEDMKAARAENLARFQINKQEEHEKWRQQFESDKQREMLDRESSIHSQDAAAADKRLTESNKAYMDRLTAAQKAAEERDSSREDRRDAQERNRLMAANRVAMQQAVERIDSEKRQLLNSITAATRGNIALQMIQDPDKRNAAMANDPTIGPMLQQLHELTQSRANTVASFTLYGASLGDPNFKGRQTSELPNQPFAPKGGGAGAMAPDDGTTATPMPPGSSTPNNPLDNNVPGSKIDPSADNAPALDPSASTRPTSNPFAQRPTFNPPQQSTVTKLGPAVRPRTALPNFGAGADDQQAGVNFPGMPQQQQPFGVQVPSLVPSIGG